MLKDPNCPYCVEGELLDAFGIKICELESSLVILFKEQSHLGRVIVASKDHIGEMVYLSDDQRNAFFKDVSHVAKAIHTVFSPDKVNYGAYGDTGNHLHFHLVPKYKNGYEWSVPFAMNPSQTFLSDEEYASIIRRIKAHL